ncbi:MAG: hypothetical protein IJP69_04330 [Synergistaceae bacterium]|nr:hypothetical protein [Synergistaceae bacterium]
MSTRLRGNTFLILLLRAGVQELSERPEWGEKNNGITRANMFADLLRMTQPEYNPPKIKTLQSYFSKYLSGEMPRSPSYFDFEKSGFKHGLSTRINNDYQTVLAEMDNFYHKYLRKSKVDRCQLVAGLVDAILQDQTFQGTFNVGDKHVDKKELKDVKNFTLQPFLLSVWNEILMNHTDASEGYDTYMEWTKEAGYNSPRDIVTEIGVERAKKITVSDKIPGGLMMKKATVESGAESLIAETVAETVVPVADSVAEEKKQTKDSGQEKSGATQQTLNKNGRVYNQNAEKIFNIENLGTLNA